MYNKSINIKKSNFLKILTKSGFYSILNKFSKINLNQQWIRILLITLLLLSLFNIYTNIFSCFEIIGNYEYYDDFESNTQQENNET
jgi:hypothetical protein